MNYSGNTTSASLTLSSTSSTMVSSNDGRYIHFALCMIVINAVMAFVSVFLNLLIILTFVSTSSLQQTPSNALVLGLAIVDFAVGIFSQPVFCIRLFSELNSDDRLYQITDLLYSVGFTLQLFVSLGTLTAITADRFLAVNIHLRYQQVVTTQRYGVALTFIWIISFLLSFTRYMVTDMENESSKNVALLLYIIVIVGIVLMNFYFVFKISRVIRRHSLQIHAQQQSVQPSIDMPRYKKSVNTMYFIIGGFVWSYVFLVGVLVVYAVIQKRSQEINCLFLVTETIMMFNGVLNPLIYCARVQEIRKAAALLSRKVVFCQTIE